MNEMEFEDLSIAQLQQILKLLDKNKNPEQAKQINAVLHSKRIAVHQQKPLEKASNLLKKELGAWTHLLTAGLLFALAGYIHFSNKIPLINLSLELEGGELTKLALVLSCIGSGLISIVQFFRQRSNNKK